MGERPMLGDRLVVDERAVARLPVFDDEAAVFLDDFGMIPRHLAAGEAQIVGLAAPDAKRILGDRDDPSAKRVGDFQPGVGHGKPGFYQLTGAGSYAARRQPSRRRARLPREAGSPAELWSARPGRGTGRPTPAG